VIAGLVILLAIVVGLLQLSPVATWTVRRLIGLVPLNQGYRIEVGRVSGNWFGGLALEDIALFRGSRELARADRLRARYTIAELRGSPARVGEIVAEGVRATATREGETWDLANALRKSADTTKSKGFAVGVIDVRDAAVAAEFSPDSVVRLRGLTSLVRDLEVGEQVTARVDRLNFALAPPRSPVWFAVSTRGDLSADVLHFEPLRIQTERTSIAGKVTLPRRLDDPRVVDRLDLRLAATPLALADLASMVPSVAHEGTVDLNATARARGGVVTAHLDAGMGKGKVVVTASTHLDRGKPRGLQLHGTLQRVDPISLSSAAPAGNINGTVDADLEGPPDSATGTADVRVADSRIGTTPLKRIDLHTEIVGRRAEVKVSGAVRPGAFALNGWITPFDSVPSYRVSGSVGPVAGAAAAGRALTGAQSDSMFDVRITLAGRGIGAMTADLAGRLAVFLVRQSGERVAVGHSTVALASGRLVARPEMTVRGGTITATATAHLGDTITYRVTNGTIAGVNVAQPGDSMAAPLNGRFSLQGRGTEPGKAVAKGEIALDSMDVGALMGRPGVVVTHGTLKAALDGQRLTYEASAVTPRGQIHASGDGRPLADSPVFAVRQGRVDSLDLSALLGFAGLKSDLNAVFTATYSGAGDSAETQFDMQMEPSTVNEVTLDAGRLALAMNRGDLRGQFSVEGPDGKVGTTVNGRVAAEGTKLHAVGTLAMEHLAKWTARKDADGRLEGEFSLDAAADSAGLRSLGGTGSALGGIGGVRLAGARFVLAPVDGAIKLDTLELRSNVAQVEGRGTVALRNGVPPGRLEISARLGDLAPLASITGDTVSMDSGSVALAFEGPAQAWRFTGKGEVHRLVYGGNLAEKVTLASNGILDSTGLGGVQGELNVTDAAYGKVSIPTLHIAARYDSVVALDANTQIGDSIRFATGLRGTVASDTIRAVLQRLDLSEGGRNWALDRPAKLELRPRVEVGALSLTAGDRRLTANGIFDPNGSSDLRVGIKGFDLDAFRSAGLVPMGGQLDGEFRLAGRREDPSIQGRVGLAIVDTKGKSSGRVETKLDWKRTGLFIDAAAIPATGGKVTVTGMLPYRFNLAPADTSENVGIERASVDTLDVRVRADSFDLSLFGPLLPPDAAKDVAGLFVANAHVGGKLDAPRAEGTFALNQAGITLPALGVSYREGQLAGRIEGDDLRIERLRLMTGKKEELTGQGVIHLKPLTDPGLDLKSQLTDFRISNSPTLQTTASGKLNLTGSVNHPSVTGGLNLGRTDVFVGAEAPAGKVEPVQLSPDDMRQLARDFGPAVLAEATKAPSLMSRARLDIDLRLPRRVWIRRRKSPEMDIELAGQMRLKQEPGGDMQFVGKVGPVPGRGTLDLSGRTFRITGGDIYLDGPVDSTKLDVTAEYQVPTQGGGQDEGVLITVAAKGRMDSLGLDFTSDPSMSQEDILSYIVTGHPASDNALLEVGGGGGTSGKQMAFGQLSQAISGAAGRGLGFDVFQIKQEGTSGLNLTAGRYLSDRFFLNLKLPLGRNTNADPGQSLGPGFELEYAMRRWLRADLRGGSLPPGFSFRGRHSY
jgi:translocation and assembly module TamB